MNDLTNLIVFTKSIISIILAFTIIIYIISIIANWKIFTKAGEKGIKSIIPFYNSYTLYKLCWETKYFWYLLVISFIYILLIHLTSKGFLGALLTLVSAITILDIKAMFCNKLASAFGKGKGFSFGLFFFPVIFKLILGFGSSEYQKNN